MSLAASGAFATCVFPGKPEVAVPDGATASSDVMLATQDEVKAYVASIEVYLACLDEETAALKTEGVLTPEQQQIYDKRYNSAVDLMQGLAERFNEQVRIYRDNNS